MRDKFRTYLAKLMETAYFKDVEVASDAWNKRVVKAREKFMRKYAGGGGEDAAAAGAPVAAAAAPAHVATEEDKARAEALKGQGNDALKAAQYQVAVELYSRAIALHAAPVYYSNRAAAYQYLENYHAALDDARTAVKLDPSFAKGYSRIGCALVSLGKHQEAIDEGFRKVLELVPGDAAALEAIATSEAQLDTAANLANNPAIRNMARNVAGAMPGAGMGAGGLGDLLNNPQLMQMGASGGC